jgi:uncharacterized protein (TIGR04255 family)
MVQLSSDVPKRTDEWDVPLGGLQGLARVMLERTHVEAAVAEVRFVSDHRELPESAAVEVWKALGTENFPVFEPSNQVMVTLTIGPEGPQQSQHAQQGWLLATSDRSTAVTLLPATVIVQTRTYRRYSTSLGEPLAKVLELFTAATGVSLIQRLGLRYINRLVEKEATSPAFWRDHVREPFAGPLNGPVAELVAGVHQQVQLRLADTAGARIQCGVFEEPQIGAATTSPNYNYLVDLDVFREQATPYDKTTSANMVRQLNRTALALFATVLSEQYLSQLSPMPVEPTKPHNHPAEGGR